MNQPEGSISDGSVSHVAAGKHTDLLAVQRKVGNQAVDDMLNLHEADNPALAAKLTVSQEQPLEAGAQARLENQVGVGLSQVQIHSDTEAAAAADAINAYAFTQGRDIFFGQNQFNPETEAGMDLIAHELSHVAEQTQGYSPAQPAMTATFIQRKALSKVDLEKKYGIVIQSGDKEWSQADIDDLSWALARLSREEAALLKGYQFLRWTDRESRRAVDTTYKPEGEEEIGLHEADTKQDVNKISMYDAAFPKNATMPSEVPYVKASGEQPIGRFHILHEMGHALAKADMRIAAKAYERSKSELDQLREQFNSSTSAAQQKKIRPAYDQKDKEVDALAARLKTSNERVLAEFAKLTEDMQPVTELAKTNIQQAFAETFTAYKLNPKEFARMHPRLADWFKKQGYLFGGK